jgi:dynein heavy chain, axonemal
MSVRNVQVERAMLTSLRNVMAKAVASYASTQRSQWVLEWPGQAVLAVTGIYWTQQITNALNVANPGALASVAESNTADLGDIVTLVRGRLERLQRATLSALVVMDVHARDAAAALAAEGIEGCPDAFSWLAQLRMYWENTDPEAPDERGIAVRMMHASADYGYEYLGNSGRLVVTPLTDRCYRTLIGAIHMHLGGAPEGEFWFLAFNKLLKGC